MEVSFIIFAFFKGHIVAYQVETAKDMEVFHLKLQHSNHSIKAIFPDKLTLTQTDGIWQQKNELEKELCSLIEEWKLKKVFTYREPLVLTGTPKSKKRRRLHKHQ